MYVAGVNKKTIVSLNLYSYLREALRVAVCQSFPDIPASSDSIHLFFKSPSPSADLSTPLALRIASLKKIPAEIVAKRIISCFKWNERFIISDPQNHQTVTAGFISFRTSLSFQYETLKKAASGMLPPFDIFDNRKHPDKTLQLLHQTTPLLKHTEKILSSDCTFEPAHLRLLSTPEEKKLIRLIAVSQTEELHSPGAAVYFLHELTQTTIRYLNAIPVFSENEQLSFSRVILIRACHNRVINLIPLNFTE
jgi:arginyl-tRNA synthetase